jgi:flagellar hook assembly protein FlgD
VLTYTVPHAQRLQITVTDIAGRTVATLANAPSAGGMHRIEWAARRDDGRRLAAGQYLIRLAGDSGVSTARVVVLE